jgi:nucleotide sugar dehydrogenase
MMLQRSITVPGASGTQWAHWSAPDAGPPQGVESGAPAAGDGRPFGYDVALVGLGYVGLPTALAFHTAGKRVLGIDVNPARLVAIESARVDLADSDMRRLQSALRGEGLDLSCDPAALRQARCVIIAVPTPIDDHLLPDLAMLRAACAMVVEQAVPGQVIILTSTSYIGSTDDLLVRPLTARGLTAGQDISVAFSPERIDPGTAHHAHEDVPRVVGGATPGCTERAAACLRGYVSTVHEVSSTGAAELTKLYENSFRAVNIALANELAEISRALELDVLEVINAAATKPFGFMPFFPGPGVGGHCIPCDPHYLMWQLRAKRRRLPVIETAMAAIAERPRHIADQVRAVLSAHGLGISGARVLLLGVAYKPDVADVRESPALEILAELRAAHADVGYHDPHIPTVRLPDGSVLRSVTNPAELPADIVVVHTLHQKLDLDWLTYSAPLVLDASYRLRDLPRRTTP